MIDPTEVNDVLGRAISERGVHVEGIMATYGVDLAKIEPFRQTYKDWIVQLPTEFLSTEDGGGGGWSFLNLCQTKDGELWTGMHQTMERLIVGAKALGLAEYVLPREVWGALPGGVPYVVFTLIDPVETVDLNPPLIRGQEETPSAS